MNLARVFPVIALIGAAVTAPQALAQVPGSGIGAVCERPVGSVNAMFTVL